MSKDGNHLQGRPLSADTLKLGSAHKADDMGPLSGLVWRSLTQRTVLEWFFESVSVAESAGWVGLWSSSGATRPHRHSRAVAASSYIQKIVQSVPQLSLHATVARDELSEALALMWALCARRAESIAVVHRAAKKASAASNRA